MRDRSLTVVQCNGDHRAVGDVAGNKGAAEARFEFALEEALEWSRAIDRVVAFARDAGARRAAGVMVRGMLARRLRNRGA